MVSQKKFVLAFIFIGLLSGFAAAAEYPTAAPSNGAIKKINMAVNNIKNAAGVTDGEIELLTDRLRAELFNTGAVNVMEREQMQAILKEQGFQQSGACSDEACLVEMGQMLGVQKMVSGSLGKLGNLFMVNLRVIDIATGQIVKVVSKDIKGNIEDIVGELRPMAFELVGGQFGPAPFASVKPAQKTAEPPVVARAQAPAKPEAFAPAPLAAPMPPVNDKNRNRFGILVEGATFPGSLTIDHTGEPGMIFPSENHAITLTNSAIKFIIKTGRFLTIDIGSGYAHGDYAIKLNAGLNQELTETYMYKIYSFVTGANYVRRLYPFKVNLGVLLDFNSMVLNVSSKLADTVTGVVLSDTTFSNKAIGGTSFGFRVGVEYLLGDHFGINCDYIFDRLTFKDNAQPQFT
ncbi:MAG: CsgG/HfaB family protein, partial [Chitinivibrionales bacterium]|nr:CsgG/HfaB family protein [Chitinivibrionales bacterium]